VTTATGPPFPEAIEATEEMVEAIVATVGAAVTEQIATA
jgi:hypothetical protein